MLRTHRTIYVLMTGEGKQNSLGSKAEFTRGGRREERWLGCTDGDTLEGRYIFALKWPYVALYTKKKSKNEKENWEYPLGMKHAGFRIGLPQRPDSLIDVTPQAAWQGWLKARAHVGSTLSDYFCSSLWLWILSSFIRRSIWASFSSLFCWTLWGGILNSISPFIPFTFLDNTRRILDACAPGHGSGP